MPELSPRAEAIKLSRLWQSVRGSEFPIKAGELAVEWSRQVARDEPIGEVLQQDLPGFEGGLFWLKTKREWVVLYRQHAHSPGRSNFTIAHEFGHYVLHRRQRDEFKCSQEATLGDGQAIERQADEFASFLLMPINDYRDQVRSSRMTLDLLDHCADRYAVSLTAAAVKWLSFTEESAIVVVAREGMVLWSRASDSARSASISRFQFGSELPPKSLAVSPSLAVSQADFRLGIEHDAGVWLQEAPVREMTIISDRYDMTISLLILERPVRASIDEEPDNDMVSGPPSF